MTTLLIFLCLILLVIVTIQIGKVTELASAIRGEEQSQMESNKWNSRLSLLFLIVFLPAVIISSYYYRNYMFGYGPLKAASEHGASLDTMFQITLFFTGIVFIITHIALFWFAYKYRGRKGRKVLYMPHDNKLEIIWTAIPAVVMFLLVAGGLDAWNEVMADVKPGEEHLEIEATGVQFNWLIRYPGADGKLGTKYYKNITANNAVGQDWNDPKNFDDFQPDEIVLPVNKKVRVRITSRDVLHNFYLPHFRVKMDAVPGMPTYFVFTPTKTTDEYRQELSKYKEYQVPADPADPNGPQKWETFQFELACAELCGQGHFSMRRIVRIVSEDEYKQWAAQQKSTYLTGIRNTDEDPNKGKLLGVEIEKRKSEFNTLVSDAMAKTNPDEKVIRLDYLFFESGSSKLTDDSRFELQNVIDALNKYPSLRIEISGHTDNIGDEAANLALSNGRAQSVTSYLVGKGINAGRLVSKGYGSAKPADTNDTEEGRAKNRRTEFKIISQ